MCETYQTSPVPCPGCGAPNNTHIKTSTREGGLEPGAVSVCAYCVTVGIFNENGSLRRPTREEATKLGTDVDVQRAVQIVKGYQLRQAWARN